MQFNITTDYAIRTVLFLAIKGGLATAWEISEATGIPHSYQLKLTAKLVRAGIIKRIQGRKGGFLLNQEKQDITLSDIVRIMEPTVHINRCLSDEASCSFVQENCPIRSFYQRMQANIDDCLQSVTVAALLDEQKTKKRVLPKA
jgi:Rrf2 family nitric oxide-sensitive transcriptional repressor